MQQTKQCKKCNLIKYIDEFKNFYCIPCGKEINKIYYINNKEKIKKKSKKEISLYNKKYYINNINKSITYREDNYEKIRKYNNIYNKSKYITDPNFKIRKLLSHRLYMAVRNTFKKGKTLDMLGCSIEEFKLYLEQQFKPEMNWDNHGIVWEMDHIKACAKFDLSNIEEQKECFHYTNIQPLFKTTETAEQHGYQNEIGNKNKGKN